MTNPARKKGTAWEMRVLAYLRDRGVDARRNPPAGRLDVGDISFTDRDGDPVVVECKNTKAIDLAGGVCDENVPLNITLLRPAGEGRNAQRWYLPVAAYDHHPTAAPHVEHGDVLHVEPTTGSKIKRAVGDLWNKP